MKKLINFFIKDSFVVNTLSLLMVVIGLISLFSMKRDLIPQWSAPYIRVDVRIPGAIPSQVEKYTIYPIEKAIKDLPGIQNMDSTSSEGFGYILVKTEDGYKEVSELETKIKDKIAKIRPTFPSSVDEIEVEQYKMTEAWFSSYALLGLDEEIKEHRIWFEKFKEKTGKISGVTRVNDNFRKKHFYLKLRPQAIARFRVSLVDVRNTIVEHFEMHPVGMFKKNGNKILVEMNVKSDTNVYDTKELLASVGDLVVRSNNSGHKLRMKDIANVEFKLSKKINEVYTNNQKSIRYDIFKDIDKDTIDLKETVTKFFKDEFKNAPSGVSYVITGDGPSYIERQINALKSNSLLGIILVVLTLMLFLGGKNALMTSFGIPLAYGVTLFVLDLNNIKIDLISVIGMLIVLGIVVDDAIIIAEQYSQNIENGQSPKDAATNAVLKCWIPITGATLTTIIAFVPIMLSDDGLSNILFAIPIVVITALSVSLFECFFILPNHLAHFVKTPIDEKNLNALDKMKGLYRSLLSGVLKLRYIFIISFVAFMAFSIYFASENIPMNFNLSINSEKVRVIVNLKEAKTINDAREKLKVVNEKLQRIDKSRYQYLSATYGYNYHNGKYEEGTTRAYFDVRFSQLDENIEENKEFVESYLKRELKSLQENKNSNIFETLEVERRFDGMDEKKKDMVEVVAYTTSSLNPMNIKKELSSGLKDIKGIKSIDVDGASLIDSYTFKPDVSKVLQFGITLRELSLQLSQYVRNSEIYEVNMGSENISVYTYVTDEDKRSLESLRNAIIVVQNGKTVKSKDLGKWEMTKKEESITHNNLLRNVRFNIPFDKKIITQSKLLERVKEITSSIEKDNPYLSFDSRDADEDSRKNKSSMMKKMIYALLGIFTVLVFILRSFSSPIVICSAIPFGVVGVIWAFYLQGLKLDIMAFIGVIAMAGVVVNDSLIMVTTINGLKEKYGVLTKEVIGLGASTRLRPIILTSITTLGGVFPMAYGIGGDSGFTKALAMSLGWGLLFATILTLVFLPSLLLVVDDIKVFLSKPLKKFYPKEVDEPSVSLDQDEQLSVSTNILDNPTQEEHTSIQ